ncbi:MAG: hypothetical protein KatS3mg077_3056 [Candidatus Binatia bacterium]|nr:MAG: hypothetical protein KatS3mg077_3056 [Candidatus Binatia bacterium]
MKGKAFLRNFVLRHKKWISSLAYTLLVASVAGLGYLTLKILEAPRTEESSPPADPAALIEFEGFDARAEKADGGWALRVSLRLRAATAHPLSCQVFFVAKGGRTNGPVLAIWPTPSPGGAPFSPAGHFRGGPVSGGAPIQVTQGWQRVTGLIPISDHPRSFHTVTVYVFGPRGEVLLSRPFDLRLTVK